MIADQKTQCWIYLSINQRNRTRNWHLPARARGFFVHYLALTFSTLLSSQVSGAHRAEIFCSGLGQRPTICGLRSSSQIGSSWFVLLGSDFLLHHGRSEAARTRCTRSVRLSVHLVGQWDPPGRPLKIRRSYASRTPLRPHPLYACVMDRSNWLAEPCRHRRRTAPGEACVFPY